MCYAVYHGAPEPDDVQEPAGTMEQDDVDAAEERCGPAPGTAWLWLWCDDGDLSPQAYRTLLTAIAERFLLIYCYVPRFMPMSHRLRHHLKAFGAHADFRQAAHRLEEPISGLTQHDPWYWGALVVDQPALLEAVVANMFETRRTCWSQIVATSAADWEPLARWWSMAAWRFLESGRAAPEASPRLSFTDVTQSSPSVWIDVARVGPGDAALDPWTMRIAGAPQIVNDLVDLLTSHGLAVWAAPPPRFAWR